MASSSLHQYSCVTCRARKVKCDKVLSGCVHCRKAKTRCIYSERRARKAQVARRELMIRPLVPTDNTTNAAKKNSDTQTSLLETSPGFDEHSTDNDGDDEEGDRLIPREMRDSSFQALFNIVQPEHGRLFISQGKSRYINSDKASQLANFEQVLATEDVSIDKVSSPVYSTSQVSCESEKESTTKSSGKLAGSSLLEMFTEKKDLRNLHPSPEIRNALWDYYVNSVDPLVKIIYRPVAEAEVRRAFQDLDHIDAAMETFLFAVYYATVTAMSAEECIRTHQEPRPILVQRYQNALEQALVQARWMTTQEVVVLQALILLMVFTPRNNVRSTWMLIGSAMGIAQSMGMHRDSDSFALSIADAELRRRIWWALCLLDKRISEDCGLEIHVPMTMDTKPPLNVNDADIEADTTGNLLARPNFTEMTMSLVKFEMVEFGLRLRMAQYSPNPYNIDQIKALAQEKIQHCRDTYLQYWDLTLPLHRLCSLGTRLIMVKIWKMMYDQCQQRTAITTADAHDVTKKGLVEYHTDVLEITHQLPDESGQFGWFFGCTSMQWHAMAYLLVELRQYSYSKPCAVVDRAWEVLDTVFRDFSNGRNSHRVAGILPHKSKLWQSLLKLSERQRHMRKQALFQISPSQQVISDGESTYTPSLFDSGYETNVSSEEQPTTQMLFNNNVTTDSSAIYNEGVLLGDPFLGSIQDFDFGLADGGEMDWDKFDALVQSWQVDPI